VGDGHHLHPDGARLRLSRRAKSAIKKWLPAEVKWIQQRRKFWSDYFWYGERELLELRKYVPRNKIAIDVGGNIGVYTYHLSRLAKQVVTIEPNPDYCSMLAALNLKNVRLERVALSSRSGVASLRVPSVHGLPDTGMASLESTAVSDDELHSCLEVPVRTLDSYRFQQVGFIKIDVEGHEESVIGGALETINRDHPAMLIEIEERHNAGGLERVKALLGSLGYTGYFFDNRDRRDLKEFNAMLHQHTLPEDAFEQIKLNRRAVRYINNFLFLQI
jgi:FkbM family methyltransferase